ncbi:IS5 family transposase [Leptolyngbya sp. BC1307]|uniref:IS5 family transposase n=1 Tax=Leptolyngbya sp. BC1307 TaxID=2029589 RepID=UPI001F0B2117|nr:IS5 family transposase [Leptolyngbya sp. BC1307]
MYRSAAPGQLSFEDFYLPFSGQLSADNRWVKLAALIPWALVEAEYAGQFSASMGAPAKTFRVALGALIIKEKLGSSDAETVQQIRENPYLQYFLGFSEYRDEAPFEVSMMVHFRKRVNLEMVAEVNERVVCSMLAEPEVVAEAEPETNLPSPSRSSNNNDDDAPPPSNQGQLIIDATCAPADIRYPTNLGLLNEARKDSEAILDRLYSQVSGQLKTKPRTYRKLARKAYLWVAKNRRPSRKQRRNGIRQQLQYLGLNLGHIDDLIALGATLSKLSHRQYRLLLVISEVYRQQKAMYQTQARRIDDRIVSITQPYVRPIVRGKAGVPVEFGAKLSISCIQGCVFLDVLSWDNFNESTHLQAQVEAYRTRFGRYPASVHADQIYRTRDHRRWCQARGIRLSGPPLGRPKQDPTVQAELKQQAKQDESVRVAVEGKFGQAKRRFSLARVMPKLAETAQCAIAITFLVLNLERWLRQLLTLLFGLFARWRSVLKYQIEPYEAVKTTISAFITAAGANAIAAPATQRLALALPLPRRIGDR